MSINIDKLSYDELIDLNNRIVERLKFLDQAQTHQQMLEFSIGERVMFEPADREAIFGIISRYNRMTVTIITEDGRQWRVSPQLLQKVPREKKQGAILSIHSGRRKESK